MNCLLLGGAQNVGKSETTYRTANFLRSNGFSLTSGTIPNSFQDFSRCVLEGLDQNGKLIKIIINSPSDTEEIINEFKTFFDNNGSNYDILISSIRDDNFYPRSDFFRIMNINNTKDFILEIPLGKITRRGNNFNIALNWYQTQMDNLINHILKNQPFNL